MPALTKKLGLWAILGVMSGAAMSPLPAPALEVPAVISGEDLLTGNQAQVEISKAKLATVIAFVSSRCPCSSSHELELKRLAALHGQSGVQFFGINSNQDEKVEYSRDHFKESAFGFPVIRDPGARIADQFGALKTPHVYVLGPTGEVLYQGGVDDAHNQKESRRHYLADALQSIVEGRKPEPSRTRTLGCLISRTQKSEK